MSNSASSQPPLVICLMGPTASGKSNLALEIAKQFGCEIINVDSALVYRHMDIGTAKPSIEILKRTRHHLIDIIEPNENYSAARFRQDALRLIENISSRGKVPLLVGGTMLYFKALSEGLSDLPEADPQTRVKIDAMARKKGWPALHHELSCVDPATAARIEPTDSQRIQRALEIYFLTGKPMSELFKHTNSSAFHYRQIKLALLPSDRSKLHQRIAQRFDAMLRTGLIDEVRGLLQAYKLNPSMPSMRCVGYRQVWQFLNGDFDQETMREKGIVATRQLAKRQLTWLRATTDLINFDCCAEDVESRVLAFLHTAVA